MPLARPTWKVIEGDARNLDVEDGSVHCALLSPPYWGLRRYLDDDREIGREDTLQEWVNNLVECAKEWQRVMRDDGTLWVNCGDAYASSSFSERPFGKGEGITGDKAHFDIPRPPVPSGLKPKDLIGLPWRLAFALQRDGWYLRSAICWAKGIDWLPNERAAQDTIQQALQKVREEATGSLFGISKGLDQSLKRAEKAVDRIMTSGPCMPESVKDRCTSSYEMLFMFSKQERYYFDQTAIRVGFADERMGNPGAYKWSYANDPETGVGVRGSGGSSAKMQTEGWNLSGGRGGRNPRSVWLLWRVNTSPQGTFVLPSGEEVSHFAAWAPLLVRRILLCATSKAGACETCGALFERVQEQRPGEPESYHESHFDRGKTGIHQEGRAQEGQRGHTVTTGWHPTCTCHGSPISGPVPCEHCRGTGHQRIGIDYEGKWEEGDEQSASRRLAANCRAARQHGAPHDQSFSVPTAVFAGDPCPHCTCPDCGGTGEETKYQRGQQSWTAGSAISQPQRDNSGGLGSGGRIPKQPTGNPCPTCSGLGSLGYLTGPVWPQDTLDNWPRVPATVLDPMAGSGTTLRAARDLGLSAIGNDLSPQYARLMRARMEAYPEDIPTKGRTKGDKEKILLSLFEAMGVDL